MKSKIEHNPLKQLIIPSPLNIGDTIGIVAPASPFDIEKFSKGLTVIESFGFKTYIHDDVYLKERYCAGSAEQRARLFNSMFQDDSIRAIMCARGGFGSMKLLPLIDYDLIRKFPKRFIGFSDITTLLCSLYEHSGVMTFHGPVVTSLANTDIMTIESLYRSLISDQPQTIETKNNIVISQGHAKARLIGGNLTTLCHLVGTPFEPTFDDHILFLEDKGEAAYRIDRMMTHMKFAGCFEKVKGVMLGTFEDCGDINLIYEIVCNCFNSDIPIIGGFEFGHTSFNQTLALGSEISLNASEIIV